MFDNNAMKIQYFLENVNIDNILIANKIPFGEKNYTLFVTWMMIIEFNNFT